MLVYYTPFGRVKFQKILKNVPNYVKRCVTGGIGCVKIQIFGWICAFFNTPLLKNRRAIAPIARALFRR